MSRSDEQSATANLMSIDKQLCCEELMDNFEGTFEDWLEEVFKFAIPDQMLAFSFNLFEPANIKGVKFGINITGSREFDLHHGDWACDVVWPPDVNELSIPLEFSGNDWQECLQRMKELTIKFLASNKIAATKLKSSQGVGIGFVDGDLEFIWQSKTE
jgi:hypothetical protein